MFLFGIEDGRCSPFHTLKQTEWWSMIIHCLSFFIAPGRHGTCKVTGAIINRDICGYLCWEWPHCPGERSLV